MFWNAVTGFVLLVLTDSYVIRFWLTFGVMVLLGFTLALKVILASIYLLKYACKNVCCKRETVENPNSDDKVQTHFNSIKESLYRDIDDGINSISTECKDKQIDLKLILTSFIGKSIINKLEYRKKQNTNWQASAIKKSTVIKNSSVQQTKNKLKFKKTNKLLQVDEESSGNLH